MDNNKIDELLQYAIEGSLVAGKKIIEIYETKDFNIKIKSDNSPLTIADDYSNNIITDYLSKTNIPVLSEEGKSIDYEIRKQWEYFWLVDPLDGTKEFIKKNGEFTVNIALIHKDTPIGGVIYVPVTKELYIADSLRAFKIENILYENNLNYGFKSLKVKAKSKQLPYNYQRDKYVVVGSRSHMNSETEQFINNLKNVHDDIDILSRGSSLKICMIAEGKADIYPRFAPTMEWDTAAGHAIAKAANCLITQSDGKTPLIYNKQNLLNPWFIVEHRK